MSCVDHLIYTLICTQLHYHYALLFSFVSFCFILHIIDEVYTHSFIQLTWLMTSVVIQPYTTFIYHFLLSMFHIFIIYHASHYLWSTYIHLPYLLSTCIVQGTYIRSSIICTSLIYFLLLYSDILFLFWVVSHLYSSIIPSHYRITAEEDISNMDQDYRWLLKLLFTEDIHIQVSVQNSLW